MRVREVVTRELAKHYDLPETGGQSPAQDMAQAAVETLPERDCPGGSIFPRMNPQSTPPTM